METRKECEFYLAQYERIKKNLKKKETFEDSQRYNTLLTSAISLYNVIVRLDSIAKSEEEKAESDKLNQEAHKEAENN